MRYSRRCHVRTIYLSESLRKGVSLIYVLPATRETVNIACDNDTLSVASVLCQYIFAESNVYCLGRAAKNGNVALFNMLVESGAVPDHLTLYWAVEHGRFDMTEYILRRFKLRISPVPNHVYFLFPTIGRLLDKYNHGGGMKHDENDSGRRYGGVDINRL